MNRIFRFDNMNKVNQVEIIYRYFDEDRYYRSDMKFIDNVWQTELSFVKDKIFYKYIVNGVIRLNDSNADEYYSEDDNEVWSVADLHTDSGTNEHILYDLKCKIIKAIPEKDVMYQDCRIFTYGKDKIISTYVEVKNISGIHSITVIWHQPDGNIYKVEEAPIVVERSYVRDVNAGFWIKLDDMQGDFYENVWMVSVYLDGKHMTKEYFVINRNIGTVKRVFYEQA